MGLLDADAPDDCLARYSREFEALANSGRRLQLDLDPAAGWALMSHLQLALRHPENVGPTSQIARQVAEQIQTYLTADYPMLAELAQRGWTE